MNKYLAALTDDIQYVALDSNTTSRASVNGMDRDLLWVFAESLLSGGAL